MRFLHPCLAHRQAQEYGLTNKIPVFSGSEHEQNQSEITRKN